jgi:alkylated DNA nucleotide flippase Atl1
MTAKDEITTIPVGMEKFFGGGGKMVRPSVTTVVKLIARIPRGKIATLDALRSKIARESKVHAACPAATMKSVIHAIDAKEQFCYWRLVKKDGQFIGQFPGGIKGHRKLLEQEGIVVDAAGRLPVVADFPARLHVFK